MGVARGCADRSLPFWWTAIGYRTADLSIVQLVQRRLCRRNDGIGDNGRCRRQDGTRAARPDGDASLLRLSHGRLFPSLAEDAARTLLNTACVPRELVPQR